MQKVQAYLKMIIAHKVVSFPTQINVKCQLMVIKAFGSDEINCPDNHLHDVIHF